MWHRLVPKEAITVIEMRDNEKLTYYTCSGDEEGSMQKYIRKWF